MTAAHGHRQDPDGVNSVKTGFDVQEGEVASVQTGLPLTEIATRWRKNGTAVEFCVPALKR